MLLFIRTITIVNYLSSDYLKMTKFRVSKTPRKYRFLEPYLISDHYITGAVHTILTVSLEVRFRVSSLFSSGFLRHHVIHEEAGNLLWYAVEISFLLHLLNHAVVSEIIFGVSP